MFTTLDAKPQEWMEGDAKVLHTVSACHFSSIEHAEYWIERLVPTNRNGESVKWSGGRRKEKTRRQFIDRCISNATAMDFDINCVSSEEGRMSWFAWAFYMQNRSLVTQRIDAKNRNNLVFSGIQGTELSFPVLRAGYLIWYNHVIRYLVEAKGASGKFISDNFCNDEAGPGAGKAIGVGLVNFLLKNAPGAPQISLPLNDRFRRCDLISDYLCGWVNSVESGDASSDDRNVLESFRQLYPRLEDVKLDMNLQVVDENGNDVTAEVERLVLSEASDA